MFDPASFGKTAADYARHRKGFPLTFFQRLAGWGIGRPGQALLDLGTGTGTLARGFAQRGCTVTGLDRAPALLEQAERLALDEGLNIAWIEGHAESTGQADASFDVVTAGQCWHWFERDRAALEVRRVLKPGGWLVLAHYDWIPIEGNVAWRTERLIEQHNPAWKFGGGNGIHPHWLTDLARAGFEALETFSFDDPAEYSHEDWRGRIRASAGVSASLSSEAVAAFDTEHAELLKQNFPAEPLIVPHRVFATIGRAPRG